MATQRLQTQIKKPIFPDIPRDTLAVDKQGQFIPQWLLGFNNLFQTLQQYFSNEGFGLPIMTLEDQQSYEDKFQKYIGSQLPPGVNDPSGKRIMDAPIYNGSTTRKPKVFVIEYDNNKNVTSATWKTYTLT